MKRWDIETIELDGEEVSAMATSPKGRWLDREELVKVLSGLDKDKEMTVYWSDLLPALGIDDKELET